MSTVRSDLKGVILMTYGSATTADNVKDFFTSIYGDKVKPETIEEFERRYSRIGSSPLCAITEEQAKLLEVKLGEDYRVRVGMRHGEPSIAHAVDALASCGITDIIGIVLSPQYSPIIMGGYERALTEAGKASGLPEKGIRLRSQWADEEHFIRFLVESIEHELSSLPENTPIVFTTHSMPKRVIDKDPSYVSQLQTTINAVLNHLPRTQTWFAGYQSAGHTPEVWLKPDLVDILNTLKHKDIKSVLIVPIQFLADHLEVLYDLDIAAKAQCDEAGIAYHRTELPNTHPLFIEALASVAMRA